MRVRFATGGKSEKGDERTRPGLFAKVLAPIYEAGTLDELRVKCLEANAVLHSYDIFDRVDVLCGQGFVQVAQETGIDAFRIQRAADEAYELHWVQIKLGQWKRTAESDEPGRITPGKLRTARRQAWQCLRSPAAGETPRAAASPQLRRAGAGARRHDGGGRSVVLAGFVLALVEGGVG